LKDNVEIIESSALYDSLKPVGEAISRVAQPHYPHPFKFFLVPEAQPNAFATPGGNVYVVDSLLYFVKNTEQLSRITIILSSFFLSTKPSLTPLRLQAEMCT